MQVSMQVLEGLERRLNIQVPAERIDKEVNKRLRDLSRSARIDGFRPGKIPLKLIRRRYGSGVRQEVIGEVLQSTFSEALVQEQLRPAGGPTIDGDLPQEGEDYQYSATFEVFPEIELTGIQDLAIERPAADVSESDIEAMLGKLQKQKATWNPVEREAADGDRITLDFHAAIDDTDFPGNSGEDIRLILGSEHLLPGFQEHLTGVKAEDVREFDSQFPDDDPRESVAGKTAHFKITIKEIAEAELPALDEEFAKEFGVEEGGLDALRTELRSNMERELEQAVRQKVKETVMQALIDRNPISIPRALVENEISHIAQQSGAAQSETEGEPVAVTEALRERFSAEAERRVALGLLISKIVSDNDIKPDPSRIEAQIDSVASTYQQPEMVRSWYAQNRKAMEGVHALVLENQVVDWIMDRAQVTKQPSTFDEIINPSRS